MPFARCVVVCASFPRHRGPVTGLRLSGLERTERESAVAQHARADPVRANGRAIHRIGNRPTKLQLCTPCTRFNGIVDSLCLRERRCLRW